MSVGGGNLENNISPNLIKALDLCNEENSKIIGIIGKDEGYTNKVGDAVLVIPTVNKDNITPHSESFQSFIWHLIVSHPKIKINQTKWESVKK